MINNGYKLFFKKSEEGHRGKKGWQCRYKLKVSITLDPGSFQNFGWGLATIYPNLSAVSRPFQAHGVLEGLLYFEV